MTSPDPGPAVDRSVREVAEAFADLGRRLTAARTVDETLAALTDASRRIIPGAEHAAVSRSRPRGGFETVGATSDLPERVDRIQYELNTGPCVDAILEQQIFRADDLRTDTHWPDFSSRAAAETGVLSMMSHRIYLEDDDLIAGINYYATTPSAFDDTSEGLGILAATHGALAFTAARQRERAGQLEQAVQTNRDIGVAMGIVMSQYKVTKQQAFDLLRVASQQTHRKLRDIADDVVESGILEVPEIPRRD